MRTGRTPAPIAAMLHPADGEEVAAAAVAARRPSAALAITPAGREAEAGAIGRPALAVGEVAAGVAVGAEAVAASAVVGSAEVAAVSGGKAGDKIGRAACR